MSSKPTHTAFIVSDGERGRKAQWFEIAALWPHQDGDGYDLVLPPGITVSGRIVIRKRKETDDARQEPSA